MFSHLFGFWGWVILVVVVGLAIVGFFVDAAREGVVGHGESVYKRKKYLFDANSEFELYKILVRLYANQYRIFAQVNYSHLLESKGRGFVASRAGRSRIDRKSADFVLCEFESAAPLLVIELDGSVHGTPKKHERDLFIDTVCAEAGLPILHLEVGSFDESQLKTLIQQKLSPQSIPNPYSRE